MAVLLLTSLAGTTSSNSKARTRENKIALVLFFPVNDDLNATGRCDLLDEGEPIADTRSRSTNESYHVTPDTWNLGGGLGCVVPPFGPVAHPLSTA